MKHAKVRWTILIFVLSLMIASIAEARFGGGRSSGSRGSRGFGTRSNPTSPSGSEGFQQPYSGNQVQPRQPMGNPNGYSPPGSGGFVRGLMGGVAGGFLGSMLFRGMGNGGGGMPGTGGIGLFEILLILGGGFFIYRMFSQRKEAGRDGYSGMSAYEKLRSVEPGPYAQQGQVVASSGEDAALQSLQESDSGFNLTRFKEDRMDDFLRLQSSWNLRDLSSVSSMITPDLRQELEKDITQLKNSHQINKIENIAVRSTDLIEAWQSDGKEFATLRFRANLLDYTIDEESGSLVAGDKTQPVKFEEDWTFVRRLGASGAWTLSAIEA